MFSKPLSSARTAEGQFRAAAAGAAFRLRFDAYRGVIVLVRVFEGSMRKGQKIRLWSNGRVF